MIQPLLCRNEAFDWFLHQMPVLCTTDGLLQAAVAISMHALDDVDPRQVDHRLHVLARRVKSRLRSRSNSAVLAHLHDVLFKEEGFIGNCSNYNLPSNSLLPMVLETRTGIPISLSLIYKVVAHRVGLQVEGINAPGHFMVRVHDERGWMIVDPFFGGVVLNRKEACQRIEQACRRPLQDCPTRFSVATHTQWISRMLANLQYTLDVGDYSADLAAMSELQSLLQHGAE